MDQYKANESSKLGFDQSAFIDERLRKNQTRTSYYSAQEIFLRQYNDTDLEKNLNKSNATFDSMLLSCQFGDTKCTGHDFYVWKIFCFFIIKLMFQSFVNQKLIKY